MKSRPRHVNPVLLVCQDDGQAPEWICLIPAGAVQSTKGDFVCDAKAMATVIAAFSGLGREMVVDYEHQTLTGEEAPAAGWLDQLEAREDGLFGHVAWMDRGRGYVASREYRYLSPVIWVRESDRRGIELHSVALTNDPAIKNMRPLVNSRRAATEDEEMDLKKAAAALGLKEDASEAEVLAAMEQFALTRRGVIAALALKADASAADVEARVRRAAEFEGGTLELLELKADAAPAAARGKLLALKQPGASTSPAELAELKRRMDERDAEDLVQLALKDGKVAPANTEWARGQAKRDLAGFREFLKGAPVMVPLGERIVASGSGSGAAGGGTFGESERAICAQLGIDEATFKKG